MKLRALCVCLLLMAMSIVSIFSYSRLGSNIIRRRSSSSRRGGGGARGQLLTRLYNGIASIKQPTNRDGLGKPKGYSEANLRYVVDRHTLSGLPDLNKPFLVLGIESSCDDTGAAVVRSDGTIMSNVVYSQHEVHEKFGGIVPSLAMEAHKSNIDKAVTEAIAAAGLKSIQDVDAIAVTKGPGLEICLRVGCRKAQELAIEYKKPFVTVHHLEAHCLMARLAGKVIEREGEEIKKEGEGGAQEVVVDKQQAQVGASKVVVPNYDDFLSEGQKRAKKSGSMKEMQEADDEALELAIALSMQEHERSQAATAAKKANNEHPGLVYFSPKVEYPFLALLASGGHTSIMLCSGLGEYQLLGGTLDDSLGEAFDKAARLLGLRMSGFGGAAVEAAAARSQAAAAAAAAAAIKTSNPQQQQQQQQQQQAQNPLNMKVPMRDKVNCDFSYAGLKNSFRVAVAKAREDAGLNPDSSNAPPSSNEESKELVVLPDAAAEDLCYHFQDIAFSHVEDRISRALDFVVGDNLVGSLGGAAAVAAAAAAGEGGGGGEKRKEITALVVVGGVAANKELRKRLLKLLATRALKQDEKLQAELAASSSSSSSFTPRKPIPLIFPPPALCTDNGVMAAWAGIEKLSIGISDDPVGQEVIARWPLGALLEGGAANFKKIKPAKKSASPS